MTNYNIKMFKGVHNMPEGMSSTLRLLFPKDAMEYKRTSVSDCTSIFLTIRSLAVPFLSPLPRRRHGSDDIQRVFAALWQEADENSHG